MPIDPSIALLLGLIAEGVGVATEIADLARRVRAGDEITEEEILAVREKRKGKLQEWDAAASNDRE